MNVERNKHYPWQRDGRWHELFIESDGTTATITLDDMQTAIDRTDGTICFPATFHVIDYKFDINTDGGTKKWFQGRTRIYENGMMGIELPAVDNFDYLYLYVFGYYDENPDHVVNV